MHVLHNRYNTPHTLMHTRIRTHTLSLFFSHHTYHTCNTHVHTHLDDTQSGHRRDHGAVAGDNAVGVPRPQRPRNVNTWHLPHKVRHQLQAHACVSGIPCTSTTESGTIGKPGSTSGPGGWVARTDRRSRERGEEHERLVRAFDVVVQRLPPPAVLDRRPRRGLPDVVELPVHAAHGPGA